MPALVLFAFGLALRLLFQAATPDGGGCWHIGFQGDAPVWQDLAGRVAHDIPDTELRLPWRPPGMTWGIAWLWDGEGATVWPVRMLFTVLGATTGPCLWLLLRGRVAAGIAFGAGAGCAASSNLLLLSSGLHAETPYLCGVLVTLLDQERLARRASLPVAVRWGLLHGLLCLLRAEHVVVFAALWCVARLRGAGWLPWLLALAAAAAPIVPWQLHANAQVRAFNAGEPPLPQAAVPWDDDALAALRRMPSFLQVPMFQFVGATMRARGRERVRVDDLAAVREAYGVDAEPLRPALIALHGGLDFWLGNTPEADGAFSRAALDRPPPLAGGEQAYPRGFAASLPHRGRFSLAYPPHVDAFVHGYAKGFAELLADPFGAAARIATKVCYGLEGATGGLGGYALPIGLSGQRRPVDLVTATGGWPALWRIAVLLAAAYGLWRLRAAPVTWPLLAFAAARFAVIAAFFGYARQGALCVPVVAVGVAAAAHAFAGRMRFAVRRSRLVAVGALAILLAIEAVRANTTAVQIDGRPWLRAAGGEAEYTPHGITFHRAGS